VTLPDLASRLKAATVVEIAEPDEELLAQVMVKLFADRQLSWSMTGSSAGLLPAWKGLLPPFITLSTGWTNWLWPGDRRSPGRLPPRRLRKWTMDRLTTNRHSSFVLVL
jgi:hypothetical protein